MTGSLAGDDDGSNIDPSENSLLPDEENELVSIVSVDTYNQMCNALCERDAEIDNLKAQIGQLKSRLYASVGLERDRHWTKTIADWVKNVLFRKMKFINGDSLLEERGNKSIAGAFKAFFPNFKEKSEAFFESFWLTYKVDINKVMSEKRNSVATEIRKGFKRKCYSHCGSAVEDVFSLR
jgi:hypothetical protein